MKTLTWQDLAIEEEWLLVLLTSNESTARKSHQSDSGYAEAEEPISDEVLQPATTKKKQPSIKQRLSNLIPYKSKAKSSSKTTSHSKESTSSESKAHVKTMPSEEQTLNPVVSSPLESSSPKNTTSLKHSFDLSNLSDSCDSGITSQKNISIIVESHETENEPTEEASQTAGTNTQTARYLKTLAANAVAGQLSTDSVDYTGVQSLRTLAACCLKQTCKREVFRPPPLDLNFITVKLPCIMNQSAENPGTGETTTEIGQSARADPDEPVDLDISDDIDELLDDAFDDLDRDNGPPEAKDEAGI